MPAPRTVKPSLDHMAIERTAPWSLVLASPSQTEHFGSTIGRHLQRGEVIALVGELGSGKTTFVRGVAMGTGLDSHVVSSPTFTFIQEYSGPLTLAHVDLYRLEQSTELADTGLADYLNGDFVVLIEWADRLPAAWLPDDHLSIHFLHTGKNTRRVQVHAFGPRSRHLLHAIMPDSG